jgi:hypothetical protein
MSVLHAPTPNVKTAAKIVGHLGVVTALSTVLGGLIAVMIERSAKLFELNLFAEDDTLTDEADVNV